MSHEKVRCLSDPGQTFILLQKFTIQRIENIIWTTWQMCQLHKSGEKNKCGSGIFLTWELFPVLQQMAWIQFYSKTFYVSTLYNQSKITQVFLWRATSLKKVGIFGSYLQYNGWLIKKHSYFIPTVFFFFFCLLVFMHNFKQTI